MAKDFFKDILGTATTAEGVEYINLTKSVKARILDYAETTRTTRYIKDGETLESLSYELYETIDYWWTIAILNNISDLLYDLPMSNIALRKYFTELVADGEIADSESEWVALMDANDAKRKVIVIPTSKIVEFMFEIKELI